MLSDGGRPLKLSVSNVSSVAQVKIDFDCSANAGLVLEIAKHELEILTAEVEHWPGEYEDRIKQEWIDKWGSDLESYERTGGCGCCKQVYTVTGPRAAMHELPNQRLDCDPRFSDTNDGE